MRLKKIQIEHNGRDREREIKKTKAKNHRERCVRKLLTERLAESLQLVPTSDDERVVEPSETTLLQLPQLPPPL